MGCVSSGLMNPMERGGRWRRQEAGRERHCLSFAAVRLPFHTSTGSDPLISSLLFRLAAQMPLL